MKVLVAGGTGVIGRQFMPMLRDHGFEAVALSRPGKGQQWLDEQGFSHVNCDVFDEDSVSRAFEWSKPDAVVNQLTAIPEFMNPRRMRSQLALTNRLRKQSTQLLAEAARIHGANRMISQSIAFAYAPQSIEPADEYQSLFEDAPSGFDDAVEAIQSLESTTLTTAGLSGIVLRYGHFCGPGTAYAPAGAMWGAVKSGQLPILGGGRGQFSFVHVRDAANATIQALQSDAAGIFNIVDSTPATLSDWLPWYAQKLEARKPRSVPTWIGRLMVGRFAEHTMVSQVGADNRKALDQLGWRPQFNTWKAGLGDSLQSAPYQTL